jgi:hypothetical protein
MESADSLYFVGAGWSKRTGRFEKIEEFCYHYKSSPSKRARQILKFFDEGFVAIRKDGGEKSE